MPERKNYKIRGEIKYPVKPLRRSFSALRNSIGDITGKLLGVSLETSYEIQNDKL